MSDNSQEITPFMTHLDAQFSGVYARLDEIKKAHHETREQMITIKANFEAHKENNVHHHTPCDSSKSIQASVEEIKLEVAKVGNKTHSKMQWYVITALIALLAVSGTIIGALVK